jgi:membrane protein implicated in regulation of membrane protease activity
MDITALITAIVVIGILCIIVGVVFKVAPVPAPAQTIIWAVVAIVCLLILLSVFTGGLNLHIGAR